MPRLVNHDLQLNLIKKPAVRKFKRFSAKSIIQTFQRSYILLDITSPLISPVKTPCNVVRAPTQGDNRSSPVPLPDLYFDSFSYPVAPIVSSAGGIV